MSNEILVSIIIPTYNRREKLEKTINSIYSQKFPFDQLEIIVVDDGSSDDTDKMINKYPGVKYLKQSNQGAAVARNKGGFNANEEFIFFIDSDCLIDENCLKILMEEIRKDQKIAVVGCKILGINKSFFARCHDYAHYSSFMTNQKEERKFLCGSGFLVRRKYFEEINGFNESYKVAEDENFGLRIFRAGYTLIYQPKAIVYHNHDRSTFKNFINQAKFWAQKGSVKPYLELKESKYAMFSSKNPYFYIFFSPIISFIVTFKIFFKIIKTNLNIIFYAPFIFLNKMAWCFGTYQYLKK